ncbi:metallophosphoesterase [Desulfovibrio sp. OttesenSCG-928-G11]|nr:metallophosphoesterase [Desulfovibrio sp. OttesenSCG-928-G11]
MREIAWLQVSDIHMRQGDEWSRDVVLRAMVDSIQQQRSQRLHLDFILATGDLAFSGNKEEYRLVERFFDELISASGVPKERIFCVPGNHDVNRNRQKLCFHGARSTLTSQNAVDAILATNNDDFSTLIQRLEDYQHFQNRYFSDQERIVMPDHLAYVSPFAIDDIIIAVVGLNSAWLADGGSGDHGKLLIGERQIINALHAVGEMNAHIVIGMAHHPLHLLQEFDRSTATSRITEYCDFYHCGHLHQPESRGSGFDASACLSVAAGAAFETRESQNAYSLVKLDLLAGTRMLTTIQYAPGQGKFVFGNTTPFPISLTPVSTCTVEELADAIVAFDGSLASYSYYLAALLMEQKAEIPIPGQSGHVFGSLAALQATQENAYCRKIEAFFRFQSVLTVLYGRRSLSNLLLQHGQAIRDYGADLHSRCQSDTALAARIAQHDRDMRTLAVAQPIISFAADLLSDLAETQDWELLAVQARRYLESQDTATQTYARRMLAGALAHSTEERDRNEAIRQYEALICDGQVSPEDYSNFAILLLSLGRHNEAQAVVLNGIAVTPCDKLGSLHEVGQNIVSQTGDRNFRKRLETAIAERGEL